MIKFDHVINLSCICSEGKVAYTYKTKENKRFIQIGENKFEHKNIFFRMKGQPFTNNIVLLDTKGDFFIFDQDGFKAKTDFKNENSSESFDFDRKGNIFCSSAENTEIKVYDPALRFIKTLNPGTNANSIACGNSFIAICRSIRGSVAIYDYKINFLKNFTVKYPFSLCFDKKNPHLLYVLGKEENKTLIYTIDLLNDSVIYRSIETCYNYIFVNDENKICLGNRNSIDFLE